MLQVCDVASISTAMIFEVQCAQDVLSEILVRHSRASCMAAALHITSVMQAVQSNPARYKGPTTSHPVSTVQLFTLRTNLATPVTHCRYALQMWQAVLSSNVTALQCDCYGTCNAGKDVRRTRSRRFRSWLSWCASWV